MMRFYLNQFPFRVNNNDMRSTVEVLDAEYVITADLPGIRKEDIKVSLEENVLTIEAKRVKDEEREFYLDERFYGEYSRTFTLKDIKDEEIKASYVDGVLTVRVPKLTEAEAKKIITIE